jgi:hypothetical protein
MKLKSLGATLAMAAVLPLSISSVEAVTLSPDGTWFSYDESIGLNNYFSETWTAASSETVRITDIDVLGDGYNVYVNGGLVASPSSADYSATGNGAFGAPYTNDAETAWLTTGPYKFSHASFSVNAGDIVSIQATYLPSGFADSTVAISAVHAVPEPETYAMMLAGLGLLGFAARRRKAAR